MGNRYHLVEPQFMFESIRRHGALTQLELQVLFKATKWAVERSLAILWGTHKVRPAASKSGAVPPNSVEIYWMVQSNSRIKDPIKARALAVRGRPPVPTPGAQSFADLGPMHEVGAEMIVMAQMMGVEIPLFISRGEFRASKVPIDPGHPLRKSTLKSVASKKKTAAKKAAAKGRGKSTRRK